MPWLDCKVKNNMRTQSVNILLRYTAQQEKISTIKQTLCRYILCLDQIMPLMNIDSILTNAAYTSNIWNNYRKYFHDYLQKYKSFFVKINVFFNKVWLNISHNTALLTEICITSIGFRLQIYDANVWTNKWE